MDRGKLIHGIKGFLVGGFTCALVLAGLYSYRNDLAFGQIFSGALLLYIVWVTREEEPEIVS